MAPVVAGRCQLAFRRVARLQPLRDERVQLTRERGIAELRGDDRGDAERHGGVDAFVTEAIQDVDQREIRFGRGLHEPVAAVRPASVLEHVRQMGVQDQDEVHASGRVHRVIAAWRIAAS